MNNCVYPITPNVGQKRFLTELLKAQIQKLEKLGGGEPHRQKCLLDGVLADLTAAEPQELSELRMLQEFAKNKMEMRKARYAINKVSDRKFRVMRLDGRSFYTPDPADRHFPKETVLEVRAVPVTANVNFTDAKRIFFTLSVGRPVPKDLEKFMVAAKEED